MPWGDGVLEGANDEELLRWGLAGDREALGAFVSRHADTLGRVMAGRHPRSVQTEDLVAETFIEAIVGLEGWQESYGTPIAWLQGIAKNLCRDEWLRAAREAEARKHLGELAIAKAATDDLEETPFDESHVNALRTCLRKLDVTERECVEMHVIQGRTWNEVGEALARTANAARKLAEKVCAALARCIRRTLGDLE